MHAITDTLPEAIFDPFTPQPSGWFTSEPRSWDASHTNRRCDHTRLTRWVKPEYANLAPRYRVAKMLGAILDLLGDSASLAQVLDYIVAQTEPLLGAAAAAIYGLDHKQGSLLLQSSWGLPPSFVTFAVMPLTDRPVIKQALAANQPLVIPGVIRYPLSIDTTAPSCRAMLLASGCYTLLMVPLTVDEERYGALLLYFVDEVELDEADLTLAMLFGRKAACGIESALAWQACPPPTLATEPAGGPSPRNGRMCP